MKLIFVFLDGVGLAESSSANPFYKTPMEKLKEKHGIEFLSESAGISHHDLVFKPIDASCQVKGIGQSGTGQFSIYTGLNGSVRFGRHHGPFLPSALKETLADWNIFAQLKLLSKTTCYANAYPHRFVQMCKMLRDRGKIRSSVLFEAAILEEVAILGAEELKRHTAVSGDIINHWWGVNAEDGDPEIKRIQPEQAAQNLIKLSEKHDAVFYEYFHTDLCGHGRITATASEIIARLDGFLSEILHHLPPDTLFVLTSDHGNFEDDSHYHHTQNPVPLLVKGKHADVFQDVEAIHQIVPAYINHLKTLNQTSLDGETGVQVA